MNNAVSQTLGLTLVLGLAAGANAQDLMPDHDASRRERLDYAGGRFRTAEGFRVESAAAPELFGSVVNMTFDAAGRPLLALEGEGLALLEDSDGDGVYDRRIDIAPQVETAHGLYVMGPGDLLVHANGDGRLAEAAGVEGEVRSNGSVEDTGLYRLRDTDGDDRVDSVEQIARATGRIQEHGPHTIARGPDGALYLLYGNYSGPDVRLAESSALRELQEDQLLPRILDPRGHANSLRAPGGTLYRVDLETNTWERLSGGLRNPFDLAIGAAGEVFAYEADMEWDRGLPWFRPTRVVHLIPAGDYGWRTGAGKFAFYEIDTLPGVVDVGRGSPVGVAFYYHHAYPERYQGAYFMGDWSRGRIRVLFPERAGATWTGEAHDFVLGEPPQRDRHGCRTGRLALLHHRRPGDLGRVVPRDLRAAGRGFGGDRHRARSAAADAALRVGQGGDSECAGRGGRCLGAGTVADRPRSGQRSARPPAGAGAASGPRSKADPGRDVGVAFERRAHGARGGGGAPRLLHVRAGAGAASHGTRGSRPPWWHGVRPSRWPGRGFIRVPEGSRSRPPRRCTNCSITRTGSCATPRAKRSCALPTATGSMRRSWPHRRNVLGASLKPCWR